LTLPLLITVPQLVTYSTKFVPSFLEVMHNVKHLSKPPSNPTPSFMSGTNNFEMLTLGAERSYITQFSTAFHFCRH